MELQRQTEQEQQIAVPVYQAAAEVDWEVNKLLEVYAASELEGFTHHHTGGAVLEIKTLTCKNVDLGMHGLFVTGNSRKKR